MSPVSRIDRDQRRLELRRPEPLQARRDRLLGRVLHPAIERRLHLPVGRMIAAELVAELLAQIVLRPPAGALARLPVRLDRWPRPRAPPPPARRVMKPCSRICASTTWLRSSAPS